MSTVRKQRNPFKNDGSYNFLKIILGVFFLFSFSLIGYAYSISDEIPSLKELENTDTSLRTEVFSKNNHHIFSIYKEDRKNVTYDQLPQHLVDALISTEDERFYDHSGIDLFGLIRGTMTTALYYASGKTLGKKSGASTITMQAAGNIFTTRVKTVRRKILEMMTALQLERTYSKKEIIEVYFNAMSYGNNAFGIESAAKTYFSKTVSELDTLEAATLVGLLKGPTRYNPVRRPERSKRRRNVVLLKMYENGKLSKQTFDSLKTKETRLVRAERERYAPYFKDRIHKELNQLGRKYGFDPLTDGLKVFTTLDTTFQNALDSAIWSNIDEIQQASLNKASSIKTRNQYRRDTTYTSTAQADSAFLANHVVQYGFIALDHRTGGVLAHNGGRGGRYFYDHVFQGVRQPGSTVKPFVYAAALEQGFSPAHKLWDGPYNYYLDAESDSNIWSPTNWDSKYLNKDVTLRYGISRSLNTIAVRLQEEIGKHPPIIRMMKDMGITGRIPAVPSLPLGIYEVSPFELVSAYSGFANMGEKIEAHTIEQIQDKYGNVIYEANFPRKEVLNKNTAFMITDMLTSSVDGGAGVTSARIRWMSKVPYNIKVAAKTGTTNNFRDAWIIAYTPRFTAALWAGIDFPEKSGNHKQIRHNIGLSSTLVVHPMGDFIRRVYEAHPEWERLEFEQPDGVVQRTICLANPAVKRANVSCPEKFDEYFRTDFDVTENCEIHKGNTIQSSGNKRRRRF